MLGGPKNKLIIFSIDFHENLTKLILFNNKRNYMEI